MKTVLKWLGAALAAGWLAGCATNTTGITVGAGTDAEGNLQEVLQVDNAKLARRLEVASVKTGQTKNGLLKANVRLASKMTKTFTAQSKFAWFDEDGVEIDPDTDSWRPLVLHGMETKTVQGVAPSAAATAFQLRIRTGDKTKWIIH